MEQSEGALPNSRVESYWRTGALALPLLSACTSPVRAYVADLSVPASRRNRCLYGHEGRAVWPPTHRRSLGKAWRYGPGGGHSQCGAAIVVRTPP